MANKQNKNKESNIKQEVSEKDETQRNERILLLGTSGSGKTTLIM